VQDDGIEAFAPFVEDSSTMSRWTPCAAAAVYHINRTFPIAKGPHGAAGAGAGWLGSGGRLGAKGLPIVGRRHKLHANDCLPRAAAEAEPVPGNVDIPVASAATVPPPSRTSVISIKLRCGLEA